MLISLMVPDKPCRCKPYQECPHCLHVIRVGVDEPTPERQSAVRDHVMRRFQEAGIGCRPYFTPIHLQPFYRAEFGFKEGDFPVTELAGRTSIAIPFHNHL
ncbi:MAG: DegT/DnrJ/EryC1/StrS family aminotransferase, partial [Clostridia bacterium]